MALTEFWIDFLQTHLVHTPNPPFSVLQQWAAANGVGVSIIAGILDTMMPAPMTHSGPVHKGSTSSDMVSALTWNQSVSDCGGSI